MNKKSLWISIIAVGLSFVGGFLLANALNRSQMDSISGENGRLKAEQSRQSEGASRESLSSEEIQDKIAEADQNPGNFQFQKNLGLALYRYSAMKKDAAMLPDAIRLLERANGIKPGDRDVQLGLGHGYFDSGYYNKNNKSFESAREYYRQALTEKPGDADIRTEIGLTYFLQDPPDLRMATENFEASLAIDPQHEKTLQFLIQSLVKQNEVEKAGQYLEHLKAANPASEALSELSRLVTNPALNQ